MIRIGRNTCIGATIEIAPVVPELPLGHSGIATRKGVHKVGGILALIVIVAAIVWLFYFLAQREKRWKALAETVARGLGCNAAPQPSDGIFEDILTYQWQTEVIEFEVAGGSVMAGRAMIMMGVLSARFKKPFPFQLFIHKKGTPAGAGSKVLSGDDSFDRTCAAESTDSTAAAQLLKNASIRREIAELIPSSTRIIEITHEGLTGKIFSINDFEPYARRLATLATQLAGAAENNPARSL